MAKTKPGAVIINHVYNSINEGGELAGKVRDR